MAGMGAMGSTAGVILLAIILSIGMFFIVICSFIWSTGGQPVRSYV